MPQTIKRIVTTCDIAGNPLRDFVGDNPRWIGFNYCVTSKPDPSMWDIVVMSDARNPPAIDRLPEPDAGSVVIWLRHQTGPECVTQRKWIEDTFEAMSYELKDVPFSHSQDTYDRYFNVIKDMSEAPTAEVYGRHRERLDHQLFGQDVTERAVAFLYALAMAKESSRVALVSLGDPAKEDAAGNAIAVAQATRGVLYQALARLSKGGDLAKRVVEEHTATINEPAGVSDDRFHVIRDTLRELCNR